MGGNNAYFVFLVWREKLLPGSLIPNHETVLQLSCHQSTRQSLHVACSEISSCNALRRGTGANHLARCYDITLDMATICVLVYQTTMKVTIMGQLILL